MRFPHGSILLLGVVTIAAYGAWNYAFGVLLDPMLVDTGWPESWVAASFSLSTALGATLAVPAGRVIDRSGSRPAFLIAAGVSSVGLVAASTTDNLALFMVGAVLGGGSLHAFAFYHITQTAATRVAPDRPARAIALLTIYGAFSSTIYLPVAAALADATGWRTTLRILVLSTAAVLVAGAVFVRERERAPGARVKPDFAAAFGHPEARRYTIATGLIGLGVGTVLVYQVPLMIGAGLTVGTAAWVAGARGLAQVTGRIPLPWMLARFGARTSVRIAFVTITIGLALLSFAGNLAVALAYVAIAGFGIGATSPLQGIYAGELFDRAHLGACLGVVTMVFGYSMAIGPALVGVLAEQTGNRSWGIVVATVAGTGAVIQMSRPLPAEGQPAQPVRP